MNVHHPTLDEITHDIASNRVSGLATFAPVDVPSVCVWRRLVDISAAPPIGTPSGGLTVSGIGPSSGFHFTTDGLPVVRLATYSSHDHDGDGVVDGADLAHILHAWTGGEEIGGLLNAWGKPVANLAVGPQVVMFVGDGGAEPPDGPVALTPIHANVGPAWGTTPSTFDPHAVYEIVFRVKRSAGVEIRFAPSIQL